MTKMLLLMMVVVALLTVRRVTARLIGQGTQCFARHGVVPAVGAAHVHFDGGRLGAARRAPTYRYKNMLLLLYVHVPREEAEGQFVLDSPEGSDRSHANANEIFFLSCILIVVH